MRSFIVRSFIATLVALAFILSGPQAMAEEDWINVYLGDSDGNQVSASGSCTIVVTPKGGARIVLKAELVEPHRGGSGARLDHGGQVISQGEYTVELAVERAEEAHGHDEAAGHGEAEEHGHDEAKEHGHDEAKEHAEVEEGLPYFRAAFSPTQYVCAMNHTPAVASPGDCPKCGMTLQEQEMAFDAVVIIKTDEGAFNVKGFEYPFLDYSSIVSIMEAHLDEIQEFIDSGQLSKVHSVASKVSRLASSLPGTKDFPEDDRSEIESTCKEIISLFGEIDEAADAGKKAETIQVLKNYRAKVGGLKQHAQGEHEHQGSEHGR